MFLKAISERKHRNLKFVQMNKKGKSINLELKVNIIEFSCLFQLPRFLIFLFIPATKIFTQYLAMGATLITQINKVTKNYISTRT